MFIPSIENGASREPQSLKDDLCQMADMLLIAFGIPRPHDSPDIPFPDMGSDPNNPNYVLAHTILCTNTYPIDKNTSAFLDQVSNVRSSQEIKVGATVLYLNGAFGRYCEWQTIFTRKTPGAEAVVEVIGDDDIPVRVEDEADLFELSVLLQAVGDSIYVYEVGYPYSVLNMFPTDPFDDALSRLTELDGDD